MATNPPPIKVLDDATAISNADNDADDDRAHPNPKTPSFDVIMAQHQNLIALPPELLNNIAGFLPTNDFNALRLTSKQLEDKLFPYWANCFFKKKQFSKYRLRQKKNIIIRPTVANTSQ